MININNFTSNTSIVEQDGIDVVIGDGYFDKIMDTINKHVKVQVDNGRIKGEQYPVIYAQLLAEALRVTQQIVLQQPISDASVKSEEAKTELYKRQAKGFDDDAKTKILKELGTIYGLAFSVAKDDPNLEIPKCIRGNTLDNLASDLLDLSKLGSMPNGSIGFSNEPFSNVTPRT